MIWGSFTLLASFLAARRAASVDPKSSSTKTLEADDSVKTLRFGRDTQQLLSCIGGFDLALRDNPGLSNLTLLTSF